MSKDEGELFHYFSLQYSSIQKTVLRHDRLWSIAGVSNILSRMNEIDMPAIAQLYNGTTIVAGGGKFTARFGCKDAAERAKTACVKLIATTLPMQEFQVSAVYAGTSFQSIKDGVIAELGELKRRFRGYAVTFNPHLQLCGECGEFPVQARIGPTTEATPVCRVCKAAFDETRSDFREEVSATTLQKIYHGYRNKVSGASGKAPAADFYELFPQKDAGSAADERWRMAVWFSDLNNMNDKVPVWLKQADEEHVLATFIQFRDTVVDIVVAALAETFDKPTGNYLPFRLVVAGGDDLCLVMAEKDILAFTRNISSAVHDVFNKLTKSDPDHPLTVSGLRKLSGDSKFEPKPFGFGGSFVVTSIQTPFSRIHRVGEELMGNAKQETDRQGNSVNWRIMADAEAVTDTLLNFERPLFIEEADWGKNDLASLTFSDYLELCKKYSIKPNKISGSHRQQIIAIMQAEKDPWKIDRQLKLLDAGDTDKSFSSLLRDNQFRGADGRLLTERIATLFELMTITGGDDHE